MALITAEYVDKSATIMWADFKDTHALYHPRAERFVGCNQDGMLILGKPHPELINGVWILVEDPDLIGKYSDLPAFSLVLKVID